MGKGGKIRAGVGWEVSKYKNTPVSSNAVVEIFFRTKDFFVDDDSRLSAVGSD
jgi:hypothetical protein